MTTAASTGTGVFELQLAEAVATMTAAFDAYDDAKRRRDDALRGLVAAGWTLAAAGRRAGLSRVTVHEIVTDRA